MSNLNNFEIHKKPKQFLAAIEHTAFETGFQPALIEKDYYCSLLLNYFSVQPKNSLTFKGGTLLAKAHAGFYRLSEDLDFTLPIPTTETRKQRSHMVKPFKKMIIDIPTILPEFVLTKEPEGSNQSKQYNSELQYRSILDDGFGRILLEIGLREELALPAIKTKLHTALLNPFNNQAIVPSFLFQALSRLEAYAEKIRAALTPQRLAIRDYYDIDYALKNNIIHLSDHQLISLVSQKIKSAGETPLVIDDTIRNILSKKINSELIPTLKDQDNNSFDLNWVLSELQLFSQQIGN